MLLHEFDPNPVAVINPSDVYQPIPDCPKTAVSCFERHTFRRMVERLGAVEIGQVSCAAMEMPIYRAAYRGRELALFPACVGAPFCVGGLEDLFFFGVEKVVLFGSCGVLDKDIANCGIIVPTSALRDVIEVNPKYREEFGRILARHGCSCVEGRVWTTDAFYRETAEKAARRRDQGCICVDMECAAVAALARFRGKDVFQFFHGADSLDGGAWDRRGLGSEHDLTEKDKIAQLALELAAEI